MTGGSNIPVVMQLDEYGRALLSDDALVAIEDAHSIVTSGTNSGHCAGTTNGACTNSGNCSGSTINSRCINSSFCGGATNTTTCSRSIVEIAPIEA